MPEIARTGVRWIATATALVVLATIAVALRGPDGPRPVPLLLLGATLALCGTVAVRRGRDGPLAGTAALVGWLVLLLGVEAALDPTRHQLDALLTTTGIGFVLLGLHHDDRRPVVVGVLQIATVAGRPVGTWRHCLVATDVVVPQPDLTSLVALGVAALSLGVVLRMRRWRPDAVHGLETTGLALVLGALAAKALELPGHRAMCGTGDAVDAGWAVLLLVAAAGVLTLGLRWGDGLWAAAGLGTLAVFSAAATVLEGTPVWGLVVGLPLVAVLVTLERAGVAWPRRTADRLGRRPAGWDEP